MPATISTEVVPLTSLVPLDRNPRIHPAKQIAALIESLEQFGQYRPLVIDEANTVLAGNGLYLAMRDRGDSHADVVRITGLTATQRQKLVLADNRLSDLSSDDFHMVEEMLREIGDFQVPGYDPDVLRALVATAGEITEEAHQYGTLTPEDRDRLLGRRATVSQAEEGIRIGPPPADVCPTCGRPL